MKSPFVCNSCLRALRLKSKAGHDGRQLIRTLQPPRSSAHDSTSPSVGENSRDVSAYPPTQYERSAEDDFLERLLADQASSGTFGLYSRARPRLSEHGLRSSKPALAQNNGNQVGTDKDAKLEADKSTEATQAKRHATDQSLGRQGDLDGLVRRDSAEGSPLYYRPYTQQVQSIRRVESAAGSNPNKTRYVRSSLGLFSESSERDGKLLHGRASVQRSGVSEKSEDLSDIFPSQRVPHRMIKESRSGLEGLEVDYRKMEETLQKQGARRVTNPKITAQQAWDNYQRFFGADTRKKTSKSQVIRAMEGDLFHRITHSWCEDPSSTIQPSVALSTLPFMERVLHIRNAVIWTILSFATKTYVSDNSRLDQKQQQLMSELVKVWTMLIHRRGIAKQELVGSSTYNHFSKDWAALSSSWDQYRQLGQVSKAFRDRFRIFFDPLATAPFHGEKHLDTALLLTFVLVHQYDLLEAQDGALKLQQMPFLKFVSSLMSYSDVQERDREHRSALQAHLHHGLQHEALLGKKIVDLAEKSLEVYAVVRAQAARRGSRTSSGSSSDNRDALGDMFQKRLERIMVTKQINKLDALVSEAEAAFRKDAPSREAPLPLGLYNRLLTAYMRFRRPSDAIALWNTLVRADVELTVVSWTAMLRGCGISGNGKLLEDMWQRLLAAGIQPDAHAWATRIDGLARCRQVDKALAAFQEMAGNWTRSLPEDVQTSDAKDLSGYGDIDGIPKPNTYCINTLVSHLTRDREDGKLAQVLQWAKLLGIQSDNHTLNPLFARALKDHDLNFAAQILQEMHEKSISPDIASFSLFITWFFRTSTDKPELAGANSNQLMTVNKVFDMIRDAGLGANAQTFTSLVSTLLQKSHTSDGSSDKVTDGSVPAAYAILDYMTEHSIPIAEQIYTTFITYHLKYQSPPDVAAVDALWIRARSELGQGDLALDVMFYDRLIEGLARINQLGKAMLALSQCAKAGIAPGWIAVKQLVHALLRAGDEERAAMVVEAVRREEGRARDRVRAPEGRQDFWAMCEREGLGGQFQPIEDTIPVRSRGAL